MTSLNTFYNRVNQAIDDTFVVQNLFDPSKTEKVPTLTQLAAEKICTLDIDLSEKNDSYQIAFLKASRSIKFWPQAHAICLSSHSKKLINEILAIKLSLRPKKSEKFLLTYLFKKMLTKSTLETKDELILLSQSLQTSEFKITCFIYKTLQKCTALAGRIENQSVKYTTATILALSVFSVVSPLFSSVQKILEFPLRIVFPAQMTYFDHPILKITAWIVVPTLIYLAHQMTKTRAPKVNKWIFRPLANLYVLPFYIPLLVGAVFFSIPANTYRKASNTLTGWIRIDELRFARKVWIKQFMIEKQQTRAKIKQLQNRVV